MRMRHTALRGMHLAPSRELIAASSWSSIRRNGAPPRRTLRAHLRLKCARIKVRAREFFREESMHCNCKVDLIKSVAAINRRPRRSAPSVTARQVLRVACGPIPARLRVQPMRCAELRIVARVRAAPAFLAVRCMPLAGCKYAARGAKNRCDADLGAADENRRVLFAPCAIRWPRCVSKT